MKKTERQEFLISLQDLKTIFKAPKNDSAYTKIKETLKTCIQDADWDFEEFVEHDYAQPEVIECVLYYMTGFFSNHIKKNINCETCCNAIASHNWRIPEDFIVDIYEDKLIPVNTNFFKFIKFLEASFQKHCHRQDLLDFILADIVESNILSFPCKNHKEDLVPFIVFHYIQFRMRQFCRVTNAEKQKENLYQKKSSKFCKT